MSRPGVPQARLQIPQAHAWPRPRLLATLERAGAARPALVLAAAGCGKTTLVAQWIDTRAGHRAWYRAVRSDASSGLGTCLARALEAARVPIPAGTGDVAAIVAAVEQLDSAVTFVIDDVHELRETPAVRDIEQLLLLAPPNLTVVLSGRAGPRLNVVRSELSGAIRLGSDDLRFRSWEVEELFRDFHGEPLRPDDAAALARRTGGWAAALQLFHLATHGRAPANRSRAVRSLTAPTRHARDYLTEQVLQALPSRLQLLLRRTCVFDVVTAARCEALLGTTNAHEELDELVHLQALTTTDDGGVTFRYHEVLRGYLEGLLYEELGGEGARAWYRHAADVVEAEGDLDGAMWIRCRGSDWEGVRSLLEANGEQLARGTSSGWTTWLPVGLAGDDPWVMLANARRLLDEGDFVRAAAAAREAQQHFGRASGRDQCREVARVATALCETPHLASPTWADMLRAATQRNPRHWAERAERELAGPIGALVSGLALAIAGDRPQAVERLERAVGDPAAPRADLAARLMLATQPVSAEGVAAAAPALDLLAVEADRQGSLWLARLLESMVRVSKGVGLRAAADAARRAAAAGDAWGSVALRMWMFEFELLNGRLHAEELDEFITACRALGAGALEAWPRSGRALLAARESAPDAEAEARAAEAFARAAGVPGAQALAYAALAMARGADGAEMLELARATGADAGLDFEPIFQALAISEEPAARTTGDQPAPAAADGAGQLDDARPAAGRGVEVTCFGPFRLRIGGTEQSLAGARPRARSLLRLLALHAEQPVHRDRLTDLLWRDLDGSAATHNLHVALSTLRRLLPESSGAGVGIERDGDAYRLVLGAGARSDVQEFNVALDRAERAAMGGHLAVQHDELQHALDLYRGDLLPEEGGAEWVLAARDQYRLLAVTAAGDLADLALAAGRPGPAAAAARRGLQIDRFDDRCWRLLIAAHRAQGDLAASHQVEREYRQVLTALGVDHPVPSGSGSAGRDGRSRQDLARNSSSPSGARRPLAGR